MPGDAGIQATQPFVLNGIIAKEQSQSCSVSVDGGTITLTISTTVCGYGGGGIGKPVVEKTTVPCAMPALEAGSYAVTATADTTLTVGGDAGSGVPLCP